jgi:outer membrane lipoprotein-sorting protein
MPRRRLLTLIALFPFLTGFDGPEAREALDTVFRNLYSPDMLVAVELRIDEGQPDAEWVTFAYGRKSKGGETRTLVYSGDGRRDAARILVFQKPGVQDRAFISDGSRGQVRPISVGKYKGALFGSDFNYADFRARSAQDYRIEVLGRDKIDGEPCRVLRLRPLEGPYTMLLAWVSEERPILLRTDYFDAQGLWKRYRARPQDVTQNFDWWVPMQDEMVDLRTGRHTIRKIRNILVGTEVPDDAFTLTRLARGKMPAF